LRTLLLILLSLTTLAKPKKFDFCMGVNYRLAHKQRPNFIQWSRMDFAPAFGLDHKKYIITYSFTTTNVSHNFQILYKFKK
jgi:hypothetical protein